MGFKMGEFRQMNTELWPLIYIKFGFRSLSRAFIDQFSSNFV